MYVYSVPESTGLSAEYLHFSWPPPWMMNEIDKLASVCFNLHFEVIDLVLQNSQRMNIFKTSSEATQYLNMDKKYCDECMVFPTVKSNATANAVNLF